MNTKKLTMLALAISASLSAAAFAPEALANVVTFSFNGSGITASGTLTASQSATPGVYDITNITGTFSDTNAGVSGAITGLYQPVSYESDTSVGIAFTSAGLSYDDTYYPAGNSPPLCYDPVTHQLTYPFSGGVLDDFGVTFDVAGGYIGEFWSNGDIPGTGVVYAAGLSNATTLLDDPNSGSDTTAPGEYGNFVTAPEPDTLMLLGAGVLGLIAFTTRRRKNSSN
jgi:hypothetical protein